MKVAINRCFGGFGLSHEAVLRYCEIKGMTVYPRSERILLDVLGSPTGRSFGAQRRC